MFFYIWLNHIIPIHPGSPKTKLSPIGRIGNLLHGSWTIQSRLSFFGLLDFQLYHAEVDVTFFLSTLPIISTNPCWTVERSPKRVRFLYSKGWISIVSFTHGALNGELWNAFEGKKWLSRKPDVVNILKFSPSIISLLTNCTYFRNDVSNEKNQERFGRLLQPGYGKSTRTSVSALEETLGMDHCRSSTLGLNRSAKRGWLRYLGVGGVGGPLDSGSCIYCLFFYVCHLFPVCLLEHPFVKVLSRHKILFQNVFFQFFPENSKLKCLACFCSKAVSFAEVP